MKLKHLYIAAMALGSVALAACDDDWQRPPMVYPSFAEDLKANMTINELKSLYWQDATSYGSEIGLTASGDSIIIMGTVANSDEDGNFSKLVIVQDETAAIAFAINESDLYKEFPRGSRVAVNMTGLTFGRYNGQEQTGAMVDGTVNRITLEAFQLHCRQAMEGGKLDTLAVTLDEIAGFRSTEDIVKWESQLVRIDGVQFTAPGEYFAPGSATSRAITDGQGHQLDVRTSQYANIAWDRCPEGEGSVVGFITLYNSNFQFVLADDDALIGFTPYQEPKLTLLNSSNADGNLGWTFDNVTLPDNIKNVWSWTSYSGKYYLNATAFNATGNTVSYAISPEIDLTAATDISVSFNHAAKFQTTIRELCRFCVREVNAATWNEIEIPAWPELDGKWTWANSGSIDLSAYAGKTIQVAFKYAGTAEGSDQWEISDLAFLAEGEIAADIPAPVPALLDVTFAGGELGGFTIDNIDLGGLTAVWKGDSKYNCAIATGYDSSDKTNHATDAWLISPTVDLSGVEGATLTFDHAINYFSSLEVAKTQATLGVREEGGQWQAVAIPDYNDNSSFTFVPNSIDLSAFAGKKIQIGFHYTSTAAKAGSWEIQNVKVTSK